VTAVEVQVDAGVGEIDGMQFELGGEDFGGLGERQERGQSGGGAGEARGAAEHGGDGLDEWMGWRRGVERAADFEARSGVDG
jgi:hypothetical protein